MVYIDFSQRRAPVKASADSEYVAFGRDFDPDRAVETFQSFWQKQGTNPSQRSAAMRTIAALILTRDVAYRVADRNGKSAAADLINAVFKVCERDGDLFEQFRKAADFSVAFLNSCPPVGGRMDIMYAELANRKTSRAIASLAARMQPGERMDGGRGGFTLLRSSVLRVACG